MYQKAQGNTQGQTRNAPLQLGLDDNTSFTPERSILFDIPFYRAGLPSSRSTAETSWDGTSSSMKRVLAKAEVVAEGAEAEVILVVGVVVVTKLFGLETNTHGLEGGPASCFVTGTSHGVLDTERISPAKSWTVLPIRL